MIQNVKATNIELTPAISDYLDKKFSAFDKFVKEEGSATCQVEVGKTTKHHKSGDVFRAEVNLRISGENYYAVCEKDDLYAAIDEVKDEILYQITSRKDKNETLMKKSALRVKNLLKGIGDWRNWRRK
jgi:ribosomal subunit interface protein